MHEGLSPIPETGLSLLEDTKRTLQSDIAEACQQLFSDSTETGIKTTSQSTEDYVSKSSSSSRNDAKRFEMYEREIQRRQVSGEDLNFTNSKEYLKSEMTDPRVSLDQLSKENSDYQVKSEGHSYHSNSNRQRSKTDFGREKGGYPTQEQELEGNIGYHEERASLERETSLKDISSSREQSEQEKGFKGENSSNFTFQGQEGTVGNSGLQNSLYQNITQNVMGLGERERGRVVNSEIVDSNVVSSTLQESMPLNSLASFSALISDLSGEAKDLQSEKVISELLK